MNVSSISKTAGIILAAGMSIRFGSPKLLTQIHGKSFIQRIVEACINSDLDHIILVLGAYADQMIKHIRSVMREPKIEVIVNTHYQEGKSQSIKQGLIVAQSCFDSSMFLVADQPYLTHEIINRLLKEFQNSSKDIGVPVVDQTYRNPMIFRKNMYPELFKLSGDSGGRLIVDAFPEKVLFVPFDDKLPFLDIDTPNDLINLFF